MGNAIPITVGVVGHLDVITTDDHRLRITKLFLDLTSEYPNSPIWLFSSLADGADRFVARIFLELKNTREDLKNRLELIVPTPFKPAEYKKDFSEASSREFDDMLSHSKRTFCISCEEYLNDRPLQYLKAGKFVADSSVILIAFWDGEKGKKGGTADIVRHKVAGDDDNVAESTFEYDGTVFIIPSDRAGSASANSANISYGEPLSLDMVRKDPAIGEALNKIEEINTETIEANDPAIVNSQNNLFRDHDKLDDPQKFIMELYSHFDVLSLRSRVKDIRITIVLFIFGLFFLLALEIYSNLFLTDLVLGSAMVLISFATVIYFYSRSKQNHKKYLINRTLAEALRIQFYWNMASITKNVSDYFLRIHRKDFTWVKLMLSAVYGITYVNRKITSEIIKDVTLSWVKSEADFFKSSISRMTKQIALNNRISDASFVISFALLISIFFFGGFYSKHNLQNYILVIVGALLGIFALIKAYIQMKGYEQLMNQYELMLVIYTRAESKINETDTYDLDPDRKNAYLKELFFVIGKEALIDNGNWYLIFKEKEPEIEGI
jgi:uncharacterized phage-like protein YoqJ